MSSSGQQTFLWGYKAKALAHESLYLSSVQPLLRSSRGGSGHSVLLDYSLGVGRREGSPFCSICCSWWGNIQARPISSYSYDVMNGDWEGNWVLRVHAGASPSPNFPGFPGTCHFYPVRKPGGGSSGHWVLLLPLSFPLLLSFSPEPLFHRLLEQRVRTLYFPTPVSAVTRLPFLEVTNGTFFSAFSEAQICFYSFPV